MGLFNYQHYVSLTMEFRCNLQCAHCMIEGTMDRLRPQTAQHLAQILERNAHTREWSGLILTGSEITLHRDLMDWARAARQHGFDHVRIQTHGMRLADRVYLQELVDAGVDEFFVSVASADAASHDGITGVSGSFDKTIRGLHNLEDYGHVVSITNSVVTERSYRQLPDLVQMLGGLRRLAQMEFWHYWPMTEGGDPRGLIANHLDVLPYLERAVDAAQALGRGVEVKNFPECLLGARAQVLDNDQPELHIDPAFWDEFSRNGFDHCVHRARCGSEKCLGLNSAYVAKFGEMTDDLHPLPLKLHVTSEDGFDSGVKASEKVKKVIRVNPI